MKIQRIRERGQFRPVVFRIGSSYESGYGKEKDSMRDTTQLEPTGLSSNRMGEAG